MESCVTGYFSIVFTHVQIRMYTYCSRLKNLCVLNFCQLSMVHCVEPLNKHYLQYYVFMHTVDPRLSEPLWPTAAKNLFG